MSILDLFLRSPHRRLILIGGFIGSLFPFALFFLSSSSIVPEFVRRILIIPLWFSLAGLSFACPSTWVTGNIENPSERCFAFMIFVGVVSYFFLGAVIAAAVARYRDLRKNAPI